MDHLETDRKISKAVALVSRIENYQYRLFSFLCLLWSQIAINGLINSMVFTNPLFKCGGKTSTESFACGNREICVYQNDFTATYYSGLYCENRDMRMTLQTIFAVGSVMGTLIVPMFSDLKGKWFATNLSLLFMLTGNSFVFYGIFIKGFITIGIGQFLSAFGSVSMQAISYSLNSDFFSDSMRQRAVIYYCAAWGLTDMSILIVYYVIPSWIFFLLILLIFPAAGLYFYFRSFFLESPHYLIIALQDYKGAIEVIQKLAQINQSEESALFQAKMTLRQLQGQLKNVRKQYPSIKQTFSIIVWTPKYLRAVCCLTLIKMGFYSFYFGAQGCLQRTGFNFGVSVFLLGFGEVTGYITGTKFIPDLKRKGVLIGTNIATAMFGMLYLTSMVSHSPLLASLILYVSFVLNSYTYCSICLLQTESFSSSIRSTAVGTIYGASYLVRLGVPFSIGFLNQKGIHPIIACSALIIIFGIIPAFPLQETYGYSNLKQPMIQERGIQMNMIKT